MDDTAYPKAYSTARVPNLWASDWMQGLVLGLGLVGTGLYREWQVSKASSATAPPPPLPRDPSPSPATPTPEEKVSSLVPKTAVLQNIITWKKVLYSSKLEKY